jgi:hypothetical protein
MSSSRWLPRALGALALVVATAAPLVAQQKDSAAPAAPAARLARPARLAGPPPVIDGRLDEAAWRDAPVIGGFVQREPYQGNPASERTEVRLLVDGEALYVAAWNYDRTPSAIVPGEKVRDGLLTNSDYFAIVLDTYRDRQNGFLFATTPAGIEYDGQIIREGEGGGVQSGSQPRAQAGAMGGFNLNWDATWTVATSQDSLGWYAEMRIPFKTLRYGSGDVQTWGMHLVRMIRRNNEEVFWAPVARQFNLYRMSLAGDLEGVAVPQQRVAQVTPYVLASTARDYAAGTGWHQPTAWGADAKIGLTPALTADLTLNTDFAQVEVDQQQTNLTRFPLFFPEKRPFFLENAGVFSAGTPQAVDLFFTRRIGIDSLGQAVPLVGGGRVTGRIGETTVGVLHAATERTARVDAQAFSVVRALQEVGRRSRFGIIGVRRQNTEKDGDNNHTLGVDGRLGLGDDWTFDAWGAKTWSPGRGNDDLAASVRGAYATKNWQNSFRFVHTGADFNPEVGFLNRKGGYNYFEFLLFRSVRDSSWRRVREWYPHLSIREYYTLDGTRQSGWIHADFTEVGFQDGGRLGPELDIYHEHLSSPFTIAPGVTLPVGGYDYAQVALDFETNPSAPLSLTFRGDYGPFYNGNLIGNVATVTFRQGATFSSSLSLTRNDVHLAQGDFHTTLIGSRLAYYFTPRAFVQALIQYNNQDAVWSANVRLALLETASTGLFVVYNEGQQVEGFLSWLRPVSRSFTVKYTRQVSLSD